MTESCTTLLKRSDVVIVGLNDREILEDLYRSPRDDQFVLDLVNIPEPHRVRGRYRGVCW
jgi:hypothetical protein